MQKLSQQTQILEDKLAQSQKKKALNTRKQARIEAEVERKATRGIAEAQNKAELELEVRELRAGKGRRGQDASQPANGSRFDPAALEQICALGAAQAWHQSSENTMKSAMSLARRNRQRQQHQCTGDESQKGGQAKTGGAMDIEQRTWPPQPPATIGFRLPLLLILLSFQIKNGAGELDQPRGGEEARGRSSGAGGDNSTTQPRSRSPRGDGILRTGSVAIWKLYTSILERHSLEKKPTTLLGGISECSESHKEGVVMRNYGVTNAASGASRRDGCETATARERTREADEEEKQPRKEPENTSRREARKPAKTVICVLLFGSAWSTAKK